MVRHCLAAITEHRADHVETYERSIVVLEAVVDATDDPLRRRVPGSMLAALVMSIVATHPPVAGRCASFSKTPGAARNGDCHLAGMPPAVAAAGEVSTVSHGDLP